MTSGSPKTEKEKNLERLIIDVYYSSVAEGLNISWEQYIKIAKKLKPKISIQKPAELVS